MNKQKIVTGLAFATLIATGLSIPGLASAYESGHSKVKKERVEHQRGQQRERVVITSKKVNKVRMAHHPRRYGKDKPGRGHGHSHQRGPRHSRGHHLGWYLDRHHRYGHPKKWHKMKKRHHRHEHRDHPSYDDGGRIRFHIEFSDWL
jgi:hypothetical protein